MSHLMYDTVNDKPVTLDQLKQVVTPEPRGPRHRPYGFGTYADDVHQALDRTGIEVLAEEYAVTKDGMRMFGLMEIGAKQGQGELTSENEWSLLLGLRGAHDQRIGRGLVIGSRAMVCSNLCFSGNVADFSTRQTTFISSRLPTLIYDAVQKIPEMAARQERVFDRYHDRELKPRAGDAALVEIYRRDGLCTAQLGRAITEWHEPSFDEHAKEGFNAWRLMNAVTQALKPTGANVNHDRISRRSQVTTKFLDEVCGIDF